VSLGLTHDMIPANYSLMIFHILINNTKLSRYWPWRKQYWILCVTCYYKKQSHTCSYFIWTNFR